MADFFTRQLAALDLTAQATTPNRGFRPGQLGALHAVLAHISVHDDPAIVCLPTGYGKTSVMMALPILTRPRRVLVVEPSDALRKQVSSHFRELSTLRRIGAIDGAAPNPLVLKHEGRTDSQVEWEALSQYDVIVSHPASSSPVHARGAPRDFFDLIIFDEAHHAPADTWAAYMEHYAGARFVFLTATPFRRDGRTIPGRLVYRYPVMRAMQEGAFNLVSFRAAPVVNPLDDHHIDRVIAETAVNQLRADRNAGFDHRLFARAGTISAARALVPLYTELGIAIEAIDSRISKRRQDECERKLVSGELDGVVCVDMFGEGYDFPKLKVAALHAPHQSLVPLIQFVGRFARVDPQTGTATLIAPVSRMREATSDLLREGVDMSRMIDEAALREMLGDAAEQELLEQLPVRRLSESDYDAVSPLALQLYAHVRLFRCEMPPNFDLVGDIVGRDLYVVKQWGSDDGLISLVLTADENPPNWATSDVLVNMRHDAFLLVYKPDSRLLYIGSTRRTEKIYLGLMDHVCADNYRALSYEETSRARAGLTAVKFFNVGLKNTTFNSQSETYRTLTGPQAERAVTAGDSRAYVQGHFFGSGFDGEDKETVGASSSSRIWSNQRLTIVEFLSWVERLDARLSGTSPFTETHLDIVRQATTLRRLPERVIAATWPKAGFKANHRVRFRVNAGAAPNYSRLAEWEFGAFICNPDEGELLFGLATEGRAYQLRFSIGGGRMVTAVDALSSLEIESATDSWMPIWEWLSDHPPIFYSADKSAFEGVNLTAAPLLQTDRLAPGDAEAIEWDNCDIEVEFVSENGSTESRRKRAELAGRLTVQERLEQYLLTKANLAALFYDHRAGEAADYVAITSSEEGDVEIALYHCKGAGGAPSGGRVGDVYEVAGQIVKSVFYCDVIRILDHMQDRMHARHITPSRFVLGDLDAVRELVTATPATKLNFAIVGVQPGISMALVDAHLADLMAFGIGHARQGGAANAYWLLSA